MIGATLFSGIGAPEVAMPHWHWPWHAEIEKFPSAVMAARHPRSRNLGDVTADDFAARASRLARPDVLVFGSPCQSFSVAGRRLGFHDHRGNLALLALRVVRELCPRWIVFENVPGLLSSAAGRDFGLFLRALEECGYLGAWRVLDAQHFGVPQRRRRVFFVGHLGDWRRAAAVLFEPEGLRRDPAPRAKARQEVAEEFGRARSARLGQRQRLARRR
jgi:DNA (cytosine-5)-methyltransferase 1